jgi:hypothetical protein
MLSADDISAEKGRTKYHTKDVLHEHDDCIRIAYEWLDAQTITKGIGKRIRPLKHIIARWGRRYVSQSDVEVAAELHPRIRGAYPYFNIGYRLVLPSESRLADISQARSQRYSLSDRDISETFATRE